jgi:hypothetical protein
MADQASKYNPAGWNVNCWPSSDASFDPQDPGVIKNYGSGPGLPEQWPNVPTPLEFLTAAPVDVTCIDAVNGVFQLTPKSDPWGYAAQLVLCLVNNIPDRDVMNIAEAKSSPFWASSSVPLTHRLALVFTCTPAGPNGDAQFQTITVPYTVALQTLGVDVSAVNAQGPDLDLFCGDQPARYAWQDSMRGPILACFTGVNGANSASGGVAVGQVSAVDPGQILHPVNAAELDNAQANTPGYAQAAAAVLIGNYLDHFEGTASVGWCPDATPVGSLVEITEEVDADGQIFSTFHCSNVSPNINPVNLMSQAARRALLGNLGSGGTK